MVDEHQKTVAVIDVAIPSNHNIRKKEHGKLEKYKGRKEELHKMLCVKATMLSTVIKAPGAVASSWANISFYIHLRQKTC